MSSDAVLDPRDRKRLARISLAANVKPHVTTCATMCKVQTLRDEVKQRLDDAVRDVFDLFERTICEFAEELRRSKDENERQRHLLDTILNPRVYLRRTDCQVKGKDSAKQQRLISVQEIPDPSIIKKEPEEFSIRQERGFQEQESTYGSLLFNALKAKSHCGEGDEEPPSSRLPQSENWADGELPRLPSSSTLDVRMVKVEQGDDYGGSELANLLHPNTFPCPQPTIRAPNSSEPDHGKKHKGDNPSLAMKMPFMCRLCGKSFRCRSTYRYHIRIHSGEKPFSCSICGHRSRQRSDLVAHFRVHTGYKPFSCTLCPMTFSRSYSLGLHMRTHTGEKPFACTVCLKRFAWKSQLKKHHCVTFASGEDSIISEIPGMQ